MIVEVDREAIAQEEKRNELIEANWKGSAHRRPFLFDE
jgi:hypothetical protein